MDKQRPRLGAAVLVMKDGKFLLGLRNKKNANNKWVIPGGGVQWGESLQNAALREIKEETNLDVEIHKLLCHKEIINLPGDYHSIVFFFLASPRSSEVIAREDISEAKFFSIAEIKELDKVDGVEWVLRKSGFWA
ncbi:MAG: NUDIX hydrolase [Candidatus Woesearchaeota archaeon]|nr:NUDIX hydrolase [Candidatus Woesearchaeota archaeon]MDP7181466.1 NUDIX hydrolase [Candidatus Woesearchaeota archaeon]MDP7198508.1 NUDIX hydrolase [Candidatus Woesearchaeota archaeon]MDP7466750.1 NUDIX hydrolase [Candidatus Woesearchaeota archaeon]MDP7647975.1 NUDIX hydrolase [Candidatus Woesearchaeota archaeon]